MKNLISIILISFILISCNSYRQIGDVNMISKRNVSMDKDYKLIKSHAGSQTKKEIKKEAKKVKATTVEQALNHTVENVAGGEFLMNVKIFLVNDTYYVVRGDVWGLTDNVQHKGWKVGDRVQWKSLGKTYKGEIVNLLNKEEATIKEDETKEFIVVKYENLLKGE